MSANDKQILDGINKLIDSGNERKNQINLLKQSMDNVNDYIKKQDRINVKNDERYQELAREQAVIKSFVKNAKYIGTVVLTGIVGLVFYFLPK